MAIDLIDRARAAVSDRAELPGMSLMEHLEELRTRLFWSVGYLAIGFVVAYIYHERIYNWVQAPVTHLGLQLNFTHPTDGLNLYIKTAFVGGTILASPADSMVIQGRVAVDQAVRVLEGKDYIKHVGPKIFMVDPSNVKSVPQDNILPPAGYKPVFSVN